MGRYTPPVDLGRMCGTAAAAYLRGTLLERTSIMVYTIPATTAHGGGVVPSPKFFILLSFYLFPPLPAPYRTLPDANTGTGSRHSAPVYVNTTTGIPSPLYTYHILLLLLLLLLFYRLLQHSAVINVRQTPAHHVRT